MISGCNSGIREIDLAKKVEALSIGMVFFAIAQ
jgi:hypothetical protein